MVKVVLIGGSGRMGRAIAAAAAEEAFQGTVQISASIGSRNTPAELDQAVAAGDVVLEFASPQSVERTAVACIAAAKPLLVGVTGLDASFPGRAQAWSERIAVLIAPNTSLGVAVLMELVQEAAQRFASSADVRIWEAHHRHKKDAPSGTARALAEAVASGRGWPLEGSDFTSVRAGDIVGEHQVIFASQGEQVILEHRASDRAVFARGALKAALWLKGARAGLFRMTDVLQKSELAVDTRGSRP